MKLLIIQLLLGINFSRINDISQNVLTQYYPTVLDYYKNHSYATSQDIHPIIEQSYGIFKGNITFAFDFVPKVTKPIRAKSNLPCLKSNAQCDIDLNGSFYSKFEISNRYSFEPSIVKNQFYSFFRYQPRNYFNYTWEPAHLNITTNENSNSNSNVYSLATIIVNLKVNKISFESYFNFTQNNTEFYIIKNNQTFKQEVSNKTIDSFPIKHLILNQRTGSRFNKTTGFHNPIILEFYYLNNYCFLNRMNVLYYKYHVNYETFVYDNIFCINDIEQFFQEKTEITMFPASMTHPNITLYGYVNSSEVLENSITKNNTWIYNPES